MHKRSAAIQIADLMDNGEPNEPLVEVRVDTWPQMGSVRRTRVDAGGQ